MKMKYQMLSVMLIYSAAVIAIEVLFVRTDGGDDDAKYDIILVWRLAAADDLTYYDKYLGNDPVISHRYLTQSRLRKKIYSYVPFYTHIPKNL